MPKQLLNFIMQTVSFKPKPLSKRKGQGGQMAIFVALIFQVLFVFFAMAINIGLVVHDKINLQNAVDLAAYYGAQKQAEWLNVMAHQNYQIRQSYKLMAWRYRVLGSLGKIDEGRADPPFHPEHDANGTAFDEGPHDVTALPVACVSYKPNFDVLGTDNLCKFSVKPGEVTQILQQIEVQPVVNVFLPFNFAFQNLVKSVNDQIFNTCKEYGGYNYLYTNLIKLAYRLDQYKLKKVILAEAMNLAKPAKEMLDINGDPVIQGIANTLLKNLTYENRASIDENDVTVLNSIENLSPDQWLNELKVNLSLLYTDIKAEGGCQGMPKMSHLEPAMSATSASLENAVQMSKDEMILMFQDPPSTDERRMSVGFEKNPWVKLYVGVRAKTRPRQIFFPFGEPVTFEAVAYATPFGGRFGPWYKDKWSPGTPASDGNKIDQLLVPLVSESSGTLDVTQQEGLLPNYSRFPGDQLGLKSALAQTALNGILGFKTKLSEFSSALENSPNTVHDPLSWAGTMENSLLRKFEIAAVAPDLFDVTYYSIEPNYGQVYYPKLQANSTKFGFTEDAIPRPDLGARADVDDLKGFSVQHQLALAGANSIALSGGLAPANLHRPKAFYFIKDRAHLLTSWVHNDVYGKYEEFPDRRFGKCGEYDDTYNQQIPGSCLFDGGRTGYSVKLISGQHLRAENLQYGGSTATGPIMNPPPDDW